MYRQIGMVFFMAYFIVVFLLQFFIIGALYTSITLFYDEQMEKILKESDYGSGIYVLADNFKEYFSFFYLLLIMMILMISLTMPVDRGISYFNFAGNLLTLVSIIAYVGIGSSLAAIGFNPHVYVYDEKDDKWIEQSSTYFSWLTVCGVALISIYAVPLTMRPLDFLSNFCNYIVGLISYFLMMPIFINIV
jgi:hypothetical protein